MSDAMAAIGFRILIGSALKMANVMLWIASLIVTFSSTNSQSVKEFSLSMRKSNLSSLTFDPKQIWFIVSEKIFSNSTEISILVSPAGLL